MIELAAHLSGVILTVRAHAGAKRNGVAGEQAGMLKVSVTQAPEKGKANQAIQAVLADALKLSKSQIELIAGETATQKKFLVREIRVDQLQARIAEALKGN
jgi:uncharacterized protein YggU (UPF0235/DUF167 family)